MKELQSTWARCAHDIAWAISLSRVEKRLASFLAPLIQQCEPVRNLLGYSTGLALIMTCRRQCTIQARHDVQISLLRLLQEMKSDAENGIGITRTDFLKMASQHASLYPGGWAREFYALSDPQVDFDSFAGTGQETLDAKKLESDINELNARYAQLAPFVDKELAHLERGEVSPPLLGDIDSCLCKCWDLVEKYHRLLFAKVHVNEVAIGPESNWDRSFAEFSMIVRAKE